MSRYQTSPLIVFLATLIFLPVLVAFGATEPKAGDFSWNARLEVPAGTGMARVVLPADVLTRLQSPDAADVRVFNANGEPVGFALTGLTAPVDADAPRRTQDYKAIPLFSTATGKSPGVGSMRVHVNDGGNTNSVWVQLATPGTSGSAASVSTLPSAIFNSLELKQTWSAIHVQATLPVNSPVRITADISTDLAQWTPVALRGRLYRFDGVDGPRNDVLEFDPPLVLDKHYLRLSWYGQEGVLINSLAGVPAAPRGSIMPVRAALPPPKQIDKATLEWSLGFMTPLSGLALVSSQPNTLVPVRIQGRNDAAQPWRQLGQTVLYRLGADAGAPTNASLTLAGPTTRQLRVQASNGLALDAAAIQASAEFRPLQVLFMASGPGPFMLAVGRAQTPATALNLADILALMPGKIEQLPLASFGEVTLSTHQNDSSWLGSITGNPNMRSWALWGVLIAGVLLLAGVALKLIRQLKV